MFPFDFSSQDSCDNAAIFGGIVVVVGVVLEAVDLFEKVRNRNESILKKESSASLWVEFFSISFVVLGLWLEIFATHKSSGFARTKSDRLTSELKSAMEMIGLQSTNISQLRELTRTQAKQIEVTQTQLTNATTQLNESMTDLQNENLPMDVGDQWAFANILKQLPGIQIKLRYVSDGKAQKSADLLSSAFTIAGWPILDRSVIDDIGEEGIVIGYNETNEVSKTAAYFFMKLLTDRNIPSKLIEDKPYLRVVGVPTNGLIIAVCGRPDHLEAKLMLLDAKEMGLNYQMPKILARLREIASKQYPDSKSLTEAQSEYNGLYLQLNSFFPELQSLSEQQQKLEDQRENEPGTNLTPGLHLYGVRIYNGVGKVRVLQ
jgi:hypothetical protein